MKHKESDLQIRCVKWFKYEYPFLAKLMEHPKNEGNGNRLQGAISKAEGVQPGVADLILHLHSARGTSLAIELKTKTGRQSEKQKEWQAYFTTAGGVYVIVRSKEEFVNIVSGYINEVPRPVIERLQKLHETLLMKAKEKEKAKFLNLLRGVS